LEEEDDDEDPTETYWEVEIVGGFQLLVAETEERLE